MQTRERYSSWRPDAAVPGLQVPDRDSVGVTAFIGRASKVTEPSKEPGILCQALGRKHPLEPWHSSHPLKVGVEILAGECLHNGRSPLWHYARTWREQGQGRCLLSCCGLPRSSSTRVVTGKCSQKRSQAYCVCPFELHNLRAVCRAGRLSPGCQ